MLKKKPDHCPECGCVLDDTLPARSPKQHRAFFQMVRIALDNWPEAYEEFQPDGITKTDRFDHLRAWLLCKAKWRRILGERLEAGVLHTETEMVEFAKALIREARSSYCFPAEHKGVVVIVAPKSIADISHEELQPVFDEVMFLIEQITGLKVEFIKQELRSIT